MNNRLNAKMKDEAETRRKNLKQLIANKTEGNATRFAEMIGMQQSQVADMLAGRKSFGEKVARKIEAKLNLEDKWLDRGPNAVSEEVLIDGMRFVRGPATPPRKIRFLGNIHLLPDGRWPDNPLSLDNVKFMKNLHSEDPQAYTVRILGDSLAPAVPSNWGAIVEPGTKPMSGCRVIATIEEGDGRRVCSVMEFLYEQDGMVALIGINPPYARLTLPKGRVANMEYVKAFFHGGEEVEE